IAEKKLARKKRGLVREPQLSGNNQSYAAAHRKTVDRRTLQGNTDRRMLVEHRRLRTSAFGQKQLFV
ncbi:MAG: hypothetical protein ACRDAM_00785, partial [Casimicrobium sp.]